MVFKEKGTVWHLLFSTTIAYIIIIGNKKKLARKRYLEYLTLATMMVSIWLLKFTPAPIRITVLLTIIFILLYRRIKKTKKK